MFNSITPMNNKQKIEILKNPNEYFGEKVVHADNKANESEEKLALISIKAAEHLNRRRLFEEAKEILEKLSNHENEINEEVRGLAYFHYGVSLEESGDTISAIKAYDNSYKLRQNSWPLFRLAKINESENPTAAFDYYSRAIINNSDLTEDASAYAEAWTKSFFNKDLYRRFNPDIASLGIDLTNHFLKHGFKEGRIGGKSQILKENNRLRELISSNFNWKRYLDANPDLEILVDDAEVSLAEAEYLLLNHYISHGRNENRSIQKDDHCSTKAPESFYNEYKHFFFRKASKDLTLFLENNEKIWIGAKSQRPPSITIILVLFNKAELTLNALKSIKHSRLNDINLIIVDNNSSDRTRMLLGRLEGNVRVILNEENLHFLESVNQALSIVDTEYVALLNNDAALQYDTLDESIACIKRYGDSAIVGGKVLHFDGYIQDAGSIVFEDGSCAGLGRRCSPNDHRFNFERQVDYVSGAYMMTTHKIFESLGGFDEYFKPAYYEETDFCFRARLSGIPTVYSPSIVISHLEYGSSSKSDSASKLMEQNQEKFKVVHRNVLQRHLHPAVFNESKIDFLMHGHLRSAPRVLVIDDRIPTALHGSGFTRSSQLISLIREEASHVSVFATDSYRSKTTTQSLPVGVECIEDERDYLLSLLSDRSDFYDYIIISREHNQIVFEQIRCELEKRGVALKATVVYDAESIFSIRDYTKNVLDTTGKHVSTLKSVDLVEITAKEVERFDRADSIISVSRYELDIFQKALPEKSLHFLGHPFESIKSEDKSNKCRRKITFMGAIHDKDSPNHDSLEWLYWEILPELAKMHIENLCISIAGFVVCNESLELIRKMKDSYSFVEFKGPVEKLDEFFSDALLFLAPTRYAAGVPHKVHMASSYNVPTITTTFVAEQLGWKKGESILVADTAIEYARLIKEAYSRPSFLENIQLNMRNSFENDCSAELFKKNLRELLALE